MAEIQGCFDPFGKALAEPNEKEQYHSISGFVFLLQEKIFHIDKN